jgi:hypothetical protein
LTRSRAITVPSVIAARDAQALRAAPASFTATVTLARAGFSSPSLRLVL